jgi:hypothetical protein
MNLTAVADRAARDHLADFGAFHTNEADGLGAATLVLLAPLEPGFWDHVSGQPEFGDGESDPLDRWSIRAITRIAGEFGGTALFPFGEPVQPFITWALRSGRAWSSPVKLLVHDTAGLMVSYRGAVLIPERLDLPEPPRNPCETCAGRPCESACPVDALTVEGYDLDRCHGYLDTLPGQSCMTRGCAVRRACPISQKYGRSEKQSAFHMERFHPCR